MAVEASSPVQMIGLPVEGLATHYGAGYNGQTLGCGVGVYSSADATITAVGPQRNRDWPCGTWLQICGSTGCILGERRDGCPGCGPNHIDLSEAGISMVCGEEASVCGVRIHALRFLPMPAAGPWP